MSERLAYLRSHILGRFICYEVHHSALVVVHHLGAYPGCWRLKVLRLVLGVGRL